MKYKNVFIDLDDTLWDFHANARIVLQEIYDEQKLFNYFKSFDEYFGIYAKRNLELWHLYGKGEITKEYLNVERFRHPMLKVGIDDRNLAEKTGIKFLDMLSTKTILMPYAKELLDYLSVKYPLTIVSNGFIEVQYKKLKSSNLEHYFTHVVLSEAAGALKPDKQIFEYALSLNGALPSETIMIGDSYEADIVGAKNAGIDQIYYPLENRISKVKRLRI
jgi:putative hydrolase of the HAD superfamily